MSKLIYGLLGERLGHSWSVPIHRALGCGDYQLLALKKEELPSFMQREDIGGLNVTIPYKRDVMQYCDVIDQTAAAIGSVNTIIRKADGRLYAYNTDAYGFEFMSKSVGIDYKGKKVVILGSGGASLTAQYVCKRCGAREIIVVSRSGSVNYENITRHNDADIIVNTTPVGMYPNNLASPIDLNVFPSCAGVIDMIYNPHRTSLLMQAEELGLPCSDGLPMLVAQAAVAENLFGIARASGCDIERLISKLRKEMCNIVLIGMPGCGKSTIGCILQSMSGMELIDIDSMIEARTGMSIPEIFEKHGENAFRSMEREEIEAAGKLCGKLIVTGGGAVLDERNFYALHQNGRIYHILRPLDELPKDGRPISQNTAPEALWERRKPLYERFRDAAVDNNSEPESAARAIWSDFVKTT